MKLIINADDFGLTNGVTYGIYDVIKYGIVTSTTLMVNTKASELAANLAKEYSDLNVGLHFNISLGIPLTNCPSLVDGNNNFIKPKVLVDDERFLEEEIYQELIAQYERYLYLVQKKPTHVDSHLYAHQIFPKVNRQIIRFSEDYQIPVRSYGNKYYKKTQFIKNFKVLNDDNFSSMMEKFKQLIVENEHCDVVELMVHPGFVDVELLNISSYNQPRCLEYEVLKSNEAKEFLKLRNIDLISFKEVLGVKNG